MVRERPKPIAGVSLTPRAVIKLLFDTLLLKPVYRFVLSKKPVNKFINIPKPKGARGKIAPYTTRLLRVPDPIVSQVHVLIERYRAHIATGGEAQNPPSLLQIDLKPVDNFNEAHRLRIEVARLRQERDTLKTKVSILQAQNESLNLEKAQLDERLTDHSKFEENWQKALTVLQQALLLKGNAGRAIKERIREALHLLENLHF